ncbi:TPA: hypothetical protein ACTELP_002870 [Legionella pneumophila]|nr:hypothetical protein [Legionella pneumophila]MCZ4726496.1 hypothetical protein [Legionella pneumophila]
MTQSNSLAAYPTAGYVLRGLDDSNVIWLPNPSLKGKWGEVV